MYSSLHNHTMYSLLDGYGTCEEYLQRVKNATLQMKNEIYSTLKHKYSYMIY